MNSTFLHGLPAEGQDHLMACSHEVSFPAGTRIFNEGDPADRFWIIRTGAVTLDVQAHGRRAATVETLGHGDLLGWSWLVPPYAWRLGLRPTAWYGPTSSTRRPYAGCAKWIPHSASH